MITINNSIIHLRNTHISYISIRPKVHFTKIYRETTSSLS